MIHPPIDLGLPAAQEVRREELRSRVLRSGFEDRLPRREETVSLAEVGARRLEEILRELARGRPRETRIQAWGALVEWFAETQLRHLVARIRRRGGPGVDLDAVLHQFLLGFFDAPPRDVESLRVEFRLRDALREVRTQEEAALPGRVSLERLPEGVCQRALERVREPTPLDLVEDRRRRRQRIGDFLATLPARRLQEVARLRYLEGCSVEEIAARLGVPAGTVKSDLNREIKPRFQQRLRETRWRDLEAEGGEGQGEDHV